MKKITIFTLMFLLSAIGVQAAVFDSTEKATEVKLSPAVSTNSSKATVTSVNNSSSAVVKTQSIKELKYSSAIQSLEDAEVELRQELSEVTAKYNQAAAEKDAASKKCKTIKKEINDINKKMKNIDKSKKIINKNLQTAAK